MSSAVPSVRVCLACDVSLARDAADCPSCGAGRAALQSLSVDPALTAGELAAGAAAAAGLVPFLLLVDRVALWWLTTSGTA